MEIDVRKMKQLVSTKCLEPSVRSLRRIDKTNKVLDCLMEDGRMSMAEISRRTGVPVSTVFDYMKIIRGQLRFVAIPIRFEDDRVSHYCSPNTCDPEVKC